MLVARGQPAEAIRLLEGLIEQAPQYDGGYVTLAKIHLSAGRIPEGLAVLERLLQRHPTHPVGRSLVREYRSR